MQRARLTDRLRADGGDGPRLVLVAAPAGFGKTTLLTQWLAAARAQRRVAWLALDEGDADLRPFLTHLVAAIQTVEPEAGAEALALLEAATATRRRRPGQPDQRPRRARRPDRAWRSTTTTSSTPPRSTRR